MLKADLVTSLIHDGERWVASNDTLTASGRTLPELDDDMRRVLRKCEQFKKGSSVMVFMGFDYSTIPTWIRQYASHYFNRYVTIDL
jgi:hypothetical protein